MDPSHDQQDLFVWCYENIEGLVHLKQRIRQTTASVTSDVSVDETEFPYDLCHLLKHTNAAPNIFELLNQLKPF